MSEIKELLKLAADSMKNRTLEELLKNDTEYQKRTAEMKRAYQSVEELELTEDQRYVIESFIARENEREYDSNVNAYMAGMLDAYEIMKIFNLTRE